MALITGRSAGGFPSATPTSRWPRLNTLLNRNLPEYIRIGLRVRWPAVLIPIALVNQILAPHAVWVAILITITSMYVLAYLWVRNLAPSVWLTRTRTGTILVAGDALREEFELRNHSRLPVIWAEFVDDSDVPGYTASRVVACGAIGSFRWHSEVVCKQRGVYRLGPHRLRLADPLGIFACELSFAHSDVVLIYPRVAQLPSLQLPHGNTGGADRRRRPLRGNLPAASVSEYRPGDSLRYIHWPSTAHRGRLMVKELEIEPSGDVWIVLDLNHAIQAGEGPSGTLEYSIMLAASLAAELLSGGERRGVGLLTVTGRTSEAGDVDEPLLLAPQPGQAQLWRILAALAPVRASNMTLADLLFSSKEAMGRLRTVIVITAQTDVGLGGDAAKHHARAEYDVAALSEDAVPGASEVAPTVSVPERHLGNWLAELLHLQSVGLDSSVLLVAYGAQDDGEDDAPVRATADRIRGLLAGYEIPCQVMDTRTKLRALLTFRRTRTMVRSTPTGGVVTYEIEEDVG